MSELVTRDNLTRWNRAGLARFRYIDANAVSYLETLRLAMKQAFTEAGINQWQDLDTIIPAPNNENAIQQQARWLAQYHGDRRDHAWEILRAYARAVHVLTEYSDAYANEKTLRTATQWNNVKRLVALLNYHPAPPSSAETPIALIVKEDKQGTLDAGFAFKNKPLDGSKPAIFETLDDIEVNVDCNYLLPLDRDKSFEPVVIDALGRMSFPLDQAVDTIAVGALGLVIINMVTVTTNVSTSVAVAIKVLSVSDTSLHLQILESTAALPSILYRYQLELLLKPDFLRSTRLVGADVMVLEPDHGLSVGQVIAWQHGAAWRSAFVREVDVNRVRLSRSAPPVNKAIYSTAYADRLPYEVNGTTVQRIIMPTHLNGERIYGADWDQNLNDIGGHSHASDGGSYLYDYIDGTAYERIYYVPDVEPISTVMQSQPQDLSFEGKAGKLSSASWVLAQTENNSYRALKIVSVDQQADYFSLLSAPAVTALSVSALFSLQLRPAKYNQNHQAVFLTDPTQRSDHHSILPLQALPASELIEPGRRLIIAGLETATAVEVKSVDKHTQQITVTPALPGSEASGTGSTTDYTRYATVIYGNVCQAGHGESQSEKVLGSGDATQSHQTFLFKKEEISYIGDSQFAAGVRAAIEITVEARTWQQVGSFEQSAPEDPHYLVRTREEGTVDIIFGDGRRARRLPSGNNNVRIRYRKGVGLQGNLAAYQLVKEVKPHYLIDSLVQPIVASGGNDGEPVSSLKENAPASVLTLQRAVSLPDFVHLAKSNSRVWDAAAQSLEPGFARNNKIAVAIVPAGGGSLGGLQQDLQDYLLAHALPRVALTVSAYRAILFNLTVTIRVKSEQYDPDQVAAAVLAQLQQVFSLERRRLAQALYRSELVAAVENVIGVENCQCQIANTGFIDEQQLATSPQSMATSASNAIKRLSPAWDQVIYLHPDLSSLIIHTEEYGG